MTPIKLAALMAKRSHKRPRRAIRAQPPRLIEHKYQARLEALARAMEKAVREIILPELPAMLPGDRRAAVDQAEPVRLDVAREDETVAEKIARLIRSVSYSLDDEFDDAALKDLVEQIGTEVNGYSRLQVGRVFKSILGVDLVGAEPDLAQAMGAFVSENVSLITSVRSQFLAQVEQVILRGMRAGLRHEAVAAQLVGDPTAGVSRLQAAEARAALIARDQTNKLYGQLNELRQAQAGVTRYTWRTALDERVRPEHADREGEEFDWSDPPSDGHPGEPINCRCYAEPIIPFEEG
jgi:SPP1 gp7 family putative phage head morphogenesis protein